MIKEITRVEFIRRFPYESTYGYGNTGYYLEDGTILLDEEWNGEEYITDEKRYRPVYDLDSMTDQGTVIGYEERM